MFDFSGVNVFITGGGSGLGRGIAQQFATWKATVGIFDLDNKSALDVASSINKEGGRATAGYINVVDENSVETALEEFVDFSGGIDLCICNAGVLHSCAVVDMEVKDWKRVMEVNAMGVFLTARSSARKMLASKIEGSIVSVASIGGKVGDALISHYCASKFAVIGFTQSLAKELGANGITVNAVCPGVVDTQMMQKLSEGWGQSIEETVNNQVIKRPQRADELALSIAHLYLNRSITGQAINVDGGTVFN